MRYILGLGNYMRNDDSIGLRIVERIHDRELDTGFEAVEIGGDDAQLLTYLREDVKKLLLVDCTTMGLAPGDFRIFGPDDVLSNKADGMISTHDGNILKLLELGNELFDTVPDIMILAIEPESMGVDMQLSDTLVTRLDSYVDAAVAEIKR